MKKTLAGAAVAALALGLVAPAAADSIADKDPRDINHGVDLRFVHVEHFDDLDITLGHTNLRPSWRTGSAGTVYVDTDPTDPGPELAFTGGFFEGTDYALVKVDGFSTTKWGKPVKGFHDMEIDYDLEQVHMHISREALGVDVEQVRVAVKVAGHRSDNSVVRDWLDEPRSWTEWVARD